MVLGAGGAAGQQAKPTASQKAVEGSGSGNQSEYFDVRLELHAYFNDHLPAGWWIAEPEHRYGEVWQVVVHLPKAWRGSPETAMMSLCPDRGQRLWREVETLSLQPFYRGLPWPGHDCHL